ncbi:MAG: hypothetical protein ACW98K_15260 [Candidatus Kariarchaeaceae archaeon]|jgi:hypothetical protein
MRTFLVIEPDILIDLPPGILNGQEALFSDAVVRIRLWDRLDVSVND